MTSNQCHPKVGECKNFINSSKVDFQLLCVNNHKVKIEEKLFVMDASYVCAIIV